jgi:type IV conjugative transfer system protein TraE
MIITLILSICLLKEDTTIILVPNYLPNPVAASKKIPSNEYLEAISRDVVYTLFNLTPNNVNYAEKTILTLAHPRTYGNLKGQINLIKENITSRKFSTAFYPIEMYPDNQQLSVVVEGVLYTYLGAKEVSKDTKVYEIKYDYTSGKLTLLGITEIEKEKE